MNVPIRNLFVVLVVLFGLLVGYTSRWTIFQDKELRENPKNTRNLVRSQRIERGEILAADGTVLARSVAKRDRDKGRKTYTRKYPLGSAYAGVVGYSATSAGQQGLEDSQDDWLTGKAVSVVGSAQGLISPKKIGDDVKTSLRPRVQQAAIAGLGNRRGAVVAMDPRSGRILAMVSSPTFDPNRLINDSTYKDRINGSTDLGSPILFRPTLGQFLPGSIFKLVTAAAALDSGVMTPSSTVDGSNSQEFSGKQLNNFDGETFGQVNLRQSLTHSINTAFAHVATKVGRRRMQTYMDRFGFGAKLPFTDFPAGQQVASGLYLSKSNGPRQIASATDSRVDIARVGIGQSVLEVTPLQMASVTATIANGGRMMKPRLVDRITDSDGRTKRISSQSVRRVISSTAASELRSMMTDVVNDGTGTGAALSGIQVGGKTGTAERDIQRGINDLWFTGFAPVQRPRVVVAVVLESTQGQGGTAAAPIARDVIQAALGGSE